MTQKNGQLISCRNCGVLRYSPLARIKLKRGSYCSRTCYWIYIKGKPNGRKGMIFSAEIRKRMSVGSIGKGSNEKNSQWKGDNVGYQALHAWIVRKLGKASFCSNDKTHLTNRYHWANISGEYKRDILDYKSLCPLCHAAFDRDKKGAIQRRFYVSA